MEWTNEKYLNFIEDYKNASVLWDIKNPNYKNNGKKRKILKTLGDKYGMDEWSLRKKIKNLRSAFHREHHRLNNKMKDDGGEGQEDDVRKWFAYDALKFILDVTGPFMAKREELSFSTEDTFHHEEPVADEHFDVSTQYIELPQLMEHSERPKTPETENVQNPVSKEEDEYDLFGRSMTMQLRKLPELLALELMQKMQFMVFSARKQLSKERNKRKLKLAKQTKSPRNGQNVQSTSKKQVCTPSLISQTCSPSNSPPSFKFETLTPEINTTREYNTTNTNQDLTYEYVTTVENLEHYSEEKCEVPDSIVMKRDLKRKPSTSIDPLEVNQSSPGTRIKHE